MRQLPPAAVIVVAALLVLPSAAAAAPTPGAVYTGGLVPERYRSAGDRATISVGVAPDGRSASVVGMFSFSCGRRRGSTQLLDATGAIGPDGRLRFEARTRKYFYAVAGAKPRGRAAVDIGFEAGVGSGSVTVRTRATGRRCVGTLPLQVRAAGEDASPPAPPVADGFYFGRGSRTFRGQPLPLAFHVRPDARKVDMALLSAPLRCRGPRTRPYTDFLLNSTPPTPIASDGTFRKVERFSVPFEDGASTRATVRFRGRFTAQGATGTYSATAKAGKPGTRGQTRCKTGTIRWTAIR